MGSYLDYLLGAHHETRFVKKDLKALIELHQMSKDKKGGDHHGNDGDEVLYFNPLYFNYTIAK